MLTDGSLNSFRTDYDFMMNGSIGNNSNSQCLEELMDLLKDAELQDYFDQISMKLKVRSPAHLKYVDEADLIEIGMSRPEIRRLHKYLEKTHPQTAIGKIKKRLSRNTSNRSVSVPRSPLEAPRAQSYCIRTGTMAVTKGGVTPITDENAITPTDMTHPIGIDSDNNSNRSFSVNTRMTTNGSIDSHGDSSLSMNSMLLSNGPPGAGDHLLSHSQLHLDEIIHEGEYCSVHKGRLSNRIQSELIVTVKVIPKTNINADINQFKKDIFVRCFFDHNNISKFFGINVDEDGLKLVSEYSELGCLEEILQSDPCPKISFPVPVLHDITVQLAKAMSYLEQHRYPHGNLNFRNVLMFPGKHAKITDAGLYRAQYNLQSSNGTLTRKHKSIELDESFLLAPELSNQNMSSSPTILSDVWSFGIMIWRLFNYGSIPLNKSMEDTSDADKNPNESTFNLAQPTLCPTMVFDLLKLCWQINPIERPTFLQLSTQIIRIHPEKLVALFDGPDPCPLNLKEPIKMLEYFKDDIIIVLDRSMSISKEIWRGCLLDGSCGYFRWSKMRAESAKSPSQQPQQNGSKIIRGREGRSTMAAIPNSDKVNRTSSFVTRTQSLSRGMSGAFAKLRPGNRKLDSLNNDGSSNVSKRSGNRRGQGNEHGRLSIDMISAPKKDFRHIGHVGCNGEVFGDVTTLYTTEAQQNIKAGVLSLPGNSEMTSNKSDNTIQSNGEDTPPYATIDVNNEIHLLHKHSVELVNTSSVNEKTVPIESQFMESSNDEFSLFDELSKQWDLQLSQLESPTSSSSCNNPPPPLPTSTPTPQPPKQINIPPQISSEVPTPSPITPEPLKPTRTNPIKPPQSLPIQPIIEQPIKTEKQDPPPPPPQPHKQPQQQSTTKVQSQPHSTTKVQPQPQSTTKPSSGSGGGFLNKFIHKSSTTPSSSKQQQPMSEQQRQRQNSDKSQSTIICDSPVYAKIQKSSLNKENKVEKKVNKKEKSIDKKKNSISGPVLISMPTQVVKNDIPIQNINNNNLNLNNGLPPETDADDIFIDCTSEVSSLQPSPKDSMINLIGSNNSPNDLSGVRTNSFSRQDSFGTTGQNGRHKISIGSGCDSSTATTVSPASSFASFGSISNCNLSNQGGPTIRMLKKSDGVFRAGGTNALNRRRPSAGGVPSDNYDGYPTLSRSRQPSMPNTTVDRIIQRQQKFTNTYMPQTLPQPNDSDDGELDATTPVAGPLSGNGCQSKLPTLYASRTEPFTSNSNKSDDDATYNSINSSNPSSSGGSSDAPESFNNQSSYLNKNTHKINDIDSTPQPPTFTNTKLSHNKIQFSQDDDEVAL